MKTRAALLLVLLTILAAGAFLWLQFALGSPFYEGPAEGTFVDIPRGTGSRAVAEALQRAKVIRHQLPFVIYARWTDAGRRLQAGEYHFETPLTPVQVLDKIVRGETYFVSVTIPEGLTARETVEQIARAGVGDVEDLTRALNETGLVEDLDPGARTLEGYLFPDTYHFARKVASTDILRSLVAQFRANYNRLVQQNPPRPGWNTHRLVTLASMIEKEVKDKAERPLVASVFVNRLDKGMPLACDPTIIYVLKQEGRFDGNLRKADLGIDSPYNTYNHAGLPPGPIANPGAASLEAALAPARTDYYYFVSRNDGTHQFSSDFRTHSLAVLRYQKHRP